MRLRFSPAVLALSFAVSAAGQSAPAASPSTTKLIVDPAAAAVKQALGAISVERWKLPRSARDTTAANLDSIARDLAQTLPPLVETADSGFGSPGAMFPVTRNLTALYEVLLRVNAVAESAAPKDQAAALEQALAGVQAARRTLEDRLQAAAAEQEHQIVALRSSLAAARPALTAAPAETPGAPPPCQPTRKRKPTAHRTS